MARSSEFDVAVLFREYGPLVLRRATRFLGGGADAEDVVQEVFVRSMRERDVLSSLNDNQLLTWLYQATTHLCLNHIRKHRRRRTVEAVQLAPSARAAFEPARAESLVQVQAVLARVDERLALAAMYVFIDGMSYSEAAELLGCSKRTVGNLVERFVAAAEALSTPAGGDEAREKAS